MQIFRGKYFQNIFLIISTSIITLILCLSVTLYSISQTHLDNQAIELNVEVVRQIKERLENEMDVIQSGISDTIVNRDVVQAIYNKQLENDYEKIVPLNQKLLSTALILDNVYSVDLYLPSSQLLISSINGATSFDNIPAQRKNLYQNVQALRRPYWTFNNPTTNTNVMSFFQPLPVGSDFPQGYFAIHVHEKLLLNILEDAYFSNLGDYYIASRNERVILHKDKDKVGGSTELPSSFTNQVQNGSEVGFFDLASKKNLLFYGKMKDSDWIIIYELPHSQLISKNNNSTFNMWIVSGVSLLIAIAITFVISIYIYSPLERRLDLRNKPKDTLFFHEWNLLDLIHHDEKQKVAKLTNQIEKDQQQLFDATFVKWLLGSQDSFHSQYTSTFFKQVENTFPVVLVIDVEKSKQKELEDNQFIQDMKKVCRDVSNQYNVKVICVPIKDLRQFAVILSLTGSSIDTIKHETIINLVERIHHSLQNKLQLQVSIGIGTLKECFEEIRDSYLEATESLQYRLIKGNNQIISFEETHYSDPLQYPYLVEEKIIKSLKNDQDQDYIDYFDQFVDYFKTQNCAPEDIYHAFSMLYTSLYRSLDEHNAVDDFTLNKFYTVLQQKTSMRELKKWFKLEILPEFLEIARQLNDNRSGQRIQMIMEYLQENVTDTHTLTSVSDYFDLNASYLSRLFKQSTGKGFVQYMTELKIQIAKKMLIETEISVSEIAAYVGYTERTFGRAFKRITNDTPANYRLKHK